MAGLLSNLFGGPAQMPGQSQGILGKLFAPEVALPMAAALMGNQGNMQNFGNAFAQGGQALAQTRQTNKTYNWLKQNAPEYAQLIDGGMDAKGALDLYGKQRFAQTQDQRLINAGGGQIYNPNTGEWISAPGGGAQEPTKIVELFDEGTGQPYKAAWNPETGTYERLGGIKAPSGMQVEMGPDGQFTLTQGPLGTGKPLNVDQGKNAGYLIRGRDAHSVISDLEEQGTSMGNKVLRNLPGGVGNYGLSAESQKFEQAKRDFVNAVLRRESGAVISDAEFENANQQYFPQPGDGPEVIEQKRRNRENAIRGFEISAGPGATAPGGTRRFRFNPTTGELE